MDFSVVTYNIHSGGDLQKIYNLEAIIAVLETMKADILGLNEVDRYWGQRSDWEDQVKILSKRLAKKNVYAPAIVLPPMKTSEQDRQYGNLLLSRFPIIESKVNRMYLNDDPTIKYDGIANTEPRSFIFAKIDIGQGKISVICTHLAVHSQEERLRQIGKIEAVIKQNPGPMILMGDLNAAADSEELSILKQYLSDPSEGKSFTTFYPENPRQIDFILTRGLVCKKIEVIKSDASDHWPVLAHLVSK